MYPAPQASPTRRQFLQAGAAAAGLAIAGPLGQSFVGGPESTLRAAQEKDPFRGFKMGIQSYSLRGFNVDEALKKTTELGLKYWETFPNHVKVGIVPGYIDEQRKKMKDAGINLVAFGVVSFNDNESKAREVFEFAKKMGIQSISANPQKNEATFKLLDKLVAEYEVNIAIHNHGPKALYDKISDVVDAVKDHHPRIGACVDTGHYLRSAEDPVEALERLKDRVFGVHLKDVKDTKIFKVVGEGDLNILGCLKVLKKINYQYCLALEYEENPMNPIPDLQVCLKHVKAAMEKLDA